MSARPIREAEKYAIKPKPELRRLRPGNTAIVVGSLPLVKLSWTEDPRERAAWICLRAIKRSLRSADRLVRLFLDEP